MFSSPLRPPASPPASLPLPSPQEASTLHPSSFSVALQEASTLVSFSTGATRGSACLPYHLITPDGIRAIASAYAEGASKYGAYNCMKGLPLSNLYNHAIEHLFKFWWGDVSEDHLGHALWNIHQMVFQMSHEEYKDLDDRYCRLNKE